MIEDILGSFGWPAALVAVVIIGAFLWSSIDKNSAIRDVRIEVVRTCAHDDNPTICADRITKALEKVR